MNSLLIEAFSEAADGWSADRVIADPELNRRFIDACRRRALDGPPVQLNLTLLNTRKRGVLPRGARRTVMRNQDAYAFAAEIAVRSLERRHRTTLDRVLCDPALAQDFNAVAAAVAPGFTALEYRWAALRLRKTSRLKPEILGRAVPSEVFGPIATAELDIARVPNQQGLYILATREKVLYVGEARNLRARLKKHLDHSDNKFLARYIWEFGGGDLFVECHVLPEGTRTDVRKAMELELIRSRQAEFNVRR
jgi:site-specific DNA-methyltransferase (adenine-specific)